VVDGEVVGVDVDADRLTGVRLADGSVVALDALAVASRVTVRSEVLADLGIVAVEHPSGMGLYVPADPMGRTEVPRVCLAGNVTDPSAQVIMAAAQGNRVGALVNAELVTEDEARAMAPMSNEA
jgi:thioredoxin reductase